MAHCEEHEQMVEKRAELTANVEILMGERREVFSRMRSIEKFMNISTERAGVRDSKIEGIEKSVAALVANTNTLQIEMRDIKLFVESKTTEMCETFRRLIARDRKLDGDRNEPDPALSKPEPELPVEAENFSDSLDRGWRKFQSNIGYWLIIGSFLFGFWALFKWGIFNEVPKFLK